MSEPTLRILLQLSNLSVGEMMAIVRIRQILGEGGRAVDDAKRFMGMLAVRGALAHAVRLGETIDQLWDTGVFVDDLDRAETWLRMSGFSLGCGPIQKGTQGLQSSGTMGKATESSNDFFRCSVSGWFSGPLLRVTGGKSESCYGA